MNLGTAGRQVFLLRQNPPILNSIGPDSSILVQNPKLAIESALEIHENVFKMTLKIS